MIVSRSERLLGAIDIAFRETRKAEGIESSDGVPSAIHSASCLPIEGPSAKPCPLNPAAT